MERIAFFLPNLHDGGAERITINLLKGISEKDIPVDLVLANAEGPYLKQVPKKVRVINLAAGRVMNAILPLSRYLQQTKPCAIVSHLSHANMAAAIAKELSRTKAKLVLVEHNTISTFKFKLMRSRFLTLFIKWLYPRANVIVGVSEGVVEDLLCQFGHVKAQVKDKVRVIYNPVVDNELIAKAKVPVNHPWFQLGSPPVFLGVGRLTEQKDFSTLIKAFAFLRKQRQARLVILGEGEERTQLEMLAQKLGVAEDVLLPGFVDNPYAYMYNSTAFILSSRWEGLPTVIIEAMACGCPVVSTNCPSGPSEILEAGKYGLLVSVADPIGLSKAMLNVLDSPIQKNLLIERAMYFSIDRAVSEYLAKIDYL